MGVQNKTEDFGRPKRDKKVLNVPRGEGGGHGVLKMFFFTCQEVSCSFINAYHGEGVSFQFVKCIPRSPLLIHIKFIPRSPLSSVNV